MGQDKLFQLDFACLEYSFMSQALISHFPLSHQQISLLLSLFIFSSPHYLFPLLINKILSFSLNVL